MSEQTISGAEQAVQASNGLPTSEKVVPDGPQRMGLGEWIEARFHWSWFTCTQSTGGVGIMLSECPKQFEGLQTIGKVVFIFNLAMFTLFTSMMVFKMIRNTKGFVKSFIVPPQCFFYGSFWLTIATIIISMYRFGQDSAGPWLVVVIRVCFWIYAAVTFTSTVVHFTIVFKHVPIKSIEMTPAWLFLVFNSMLTGTIASAIAAGQPSHQRIPIIVAGVAYQGLGWLVSMLILTWFLGHLMEKGWPPTSMTPALFMTVGTSGYTIVALIGCAEAIPEGHGYFASHPLGKEILLLVATWVGIFLWLFTLWLFGLAFVITLSVCVTRVNGKWKFPMAFNNAWWAFIFPNVGFTLATAFIGNQLESSAIQWVSAIMTILVVIFWLMDLILMAKTAYISFFKDARLKL